MADQLAARQDGDYKIISSSDDVCYTPIGPAMVPVPYSVCIDLSGSTATSSNVNFNGQPAFILNSDSTKTEGAEAGKGGGIVSGTVGEKATPQAGSKSFNVNGQAVIRVGDKFDMNNGNTVGALVCTAPVGDLYPDGCDSRESGVCIAGEKFGTRSFRTQEELEQLYREDGLAEHGVSLDDYKRALEEHRHLAEGRIDPLFPELWGFGGGGLWRGLFGRFAKRAAVKTVTLTAAEKQAREFAKRQLLEKASVESGAVILKEEKKLIFKRKLDFLFNKNINKSSAYNAARAEGNHKRIGIADTLSNRQKVIEYFNKAYNNPSSIIDTVGERVTREFFLPGITGTGSRIVFVEEKGQIITIIAK